ncbi:MAG: hypothetical protein ACYTXE_36455, partial [Nostoc sp.]
SRLMCDRGNYSGVSRAYRSRSVSLAQPLVEKRSYRFCCSTCWTLRSPTSQRSRGSESLE